MIYENVLETVGDTPSVKINFTNSYCEHQIYLKMESANPTLSIKDRAAIYVIEQAEKRGDLKPGGTIIESTSGNFGKALAMIGAVKGYRVIIVVDSKVSKATVGFYKAMGAEVDLVTNTDYPGGLQKARIARVKELLNSIPGAFWSNQYENSDNPKAHQISTAKEVINTFETLDYLVGSVSTGGHLSGLSKELKSHYPALQVGAVDVQGSAIFGFPFKYYLLNGIGLSWKPGNLDKDYIDTVHIVSDQHAFSSCHLVAQHEGILMGGSGGAVLFSCIAAAFRQTKPSRILGILPDTGMNYLDTLYNLEWIKENQISLIGSISELVDSAKYSSQNFSLDELDEFNDDMSKRQLA